MIGVPFIQFLTATGGGWVIYVLIALSVLALAVILERSVIFMRQSRYIETQLPVVTGKLDEGTGGVLQALEKDTIPYRVAKEVLSQPSKRMRDLERHLETSLRLEKRYLEKNLVILGTLGNNAPFIGLLGTVLGVIRAFHDLSAAGSGPEVVMQGISEALVATAVGILVALPCVGFYNFLQLKAKNLINDLDRFGHQLIDVVQSENPDSALKGQ